MPLCVDSRRLNRPICLTEDRLPRGVGVSASSQRADYETKGETAELLT